MKIKRLMVVALMVFATIGLVPTGVQAQADPCDRVERALRKFGIELALINCG
jgi:hypothetical protein